MFIVYTETHIQYWTHTVYGLGWNESICTLCPKKRTNFETL